MPFWYVSRWRVEKIDRGSPTLGWETLPPFFVRKVILTFLDSPGAAGGL